MNYKDKHYLPLFIQSQKVLLLGGSEIAEHKYEIIRHSKVSIKVVAKEIKESLLNKIKQDQCNYEIRPFSLSDLHDCDLVVSALNDKKANLYLYQEVKKKNKLINCVDDAKLSNFIFPAIIKKDQVLIAISTGGKSPLYASWLRSKILQSLPRHFTSLANFVFKHRAQVKAKIKPNLQVSFWHWFLDKYQDGYQNNLVKISKEIQDYQKNNHTKGKVYLIGAGPGASEHLTLKAARLLARAEVVLYDGLVSDEVLHFVRKEAIRIDVSKRCGKKHINQDDINQLLINHAKKYQTVIRLKSGDPLIFSRGSEELQALKTNHIEAEIIPGISAFQAAAASYQFAVTHRDYAKGLQLHSLHNLKNYDSQFFHHLAQSKDTFAFYMTSNQLDELLKTLLKHGVNPHLGIALISNISREQECIFVGTLKNIKAKLPKEVLKPCLMIVGETINQNLKQSVNQNLNQNFNQIEQLKKVFLKQTFNQENIETNHPLDGSLKKIIEQ